MPKPFEDCVKNGGRVRTKDLGDGKYMRICFLNGKSYPGEVRTKQAEGGEDILKNKTEEIKKQNNFNESLSFKVKEGTIDEEKRTVRVCALAACVSKNGRYYSPTVVESVSGTLKGKKSFADHDERDTKNLIGKIVSEEYKDGRLYADIKISKASGVSKSTWEKILDGTIDSVSIAASGNSKRVKMGEEYVDEVTSLNIHSVDFVTEGGVEDAKVLRVFEDIKTIPQTSEVTEKMIENVQQLKEEYPDLVKEIEDILQKEIATLKEQIEKAEAEKLEKELSAHKESEISKLEVSEKIKDILRTRVSGKTTEEVSESVKKELDFITQIAEASKEKAKVEGIQAAGSETPKQEENKTWSSTKVNEDSRIPVGFKGQAIEILWEDGAEAMVAYLTARGIKL